MNRPFIITTGIVLLLFMVGLWGYLLAYGAPEKPREVFSNLGFLKEDTHVTPRVVDPYVEQNPGVQLSLGGALLQQLTTRAVAGFAFVPDKQKALRYIERGTGYAFEIDLTTGTETQISMTTLPQTAEAVFGPNAASVVLTSYDNYDKKHLLGVFENGELMTTPLPEKTDNIAYGDANTVLFSREENGQTIGYTYNIEKKTTAQIARVPFAANTFVWGPDSNTIYAYPKPTESMESPVYKVGNTLTPVGNGGKGSVALAEDTFVVVTTQNNSHYTSTAYIDGGTYAQAITMLPEKCDFVFEQAAAYCASPLEGTTLASSMSWYKGSALQSDYLWYVDLFDGRAIPNANPKELVGRTIDVDQMRVDQSATMLLFRNRLDGALWLYRIEQAP